MQCLLCRRPSHGQLCNRHSSLYIFDKEQNWFRRRKKLSRVAQRSLHRIRGRFGHEEDKLRFVLESIFGRTSVIAGVHPVWAVSPKTGALMEFDIGIVDRDVLVEYNGQQHDCYPNYFHKTKRAFLEQKLRDLTKARQASEHGYKLLVFDYRKSITYGLVAERLKTEGLL